MKRKQGAWAILVTFLVCLLLSSYVGYSIHLVNDQITEQCFEELASACTRLAAQLHSAVEMDTTVLQSMAALLEKQEGLPDAELCRLLSAYDFPTSYVDYVELLRPDGTMLDSGGTVRDVSATFDFAAEAARGAYVSNIEWSTRDASERVVRNAVPVAVNGQTTAMLYGVVRLSTLAETYATDIYDGHAYVLLVDSTTGDMLLDTWHRSFGNLYDFGSRDMLPGYDFDTAMDNVRNGIPGNLGFVSKTTGSVLYLRYAPVGINNWSTHILVEEKYALAQNREISTILYRMAAVIGTVVLLYMGFVLLSLLKSYRHVRKLGLEDQTTGLQNRNAYDSFTDDFRTKSFSLIACVYVDANGLHEVNNRFGHSVGDQMLRVIAEALRGQFRSREIYRIGGDEYVIFCEGVNEAACRTRMEKAAAQIAAKDYSISYGIACRADETGVDRLVHEADERMLENKRQYYRLNDRRKDRSDASAHQARSSEDDA